MKYELIQVAKIPPDGRSNRVPVGFYEDILKVFKELQYPIAQITVEGRNPDTVARRLEIHADHNISVISRGAGVYLRNNELIRYNESCDNPPKGGW